MAKKIPVLPVTSTTIDIIKNKKIDAKFEPSIKTLTRILNCVEEQGPSARTRLSHKTNLNYSRLAKHVVWLEKKGFVELIIKESKINIKLTENGKLFAKTISND